MGKGPLSGITVLEFAAVGPAAFTAMLLSDMGAKVIRVDRKGTNNNNFESGLDPKFDTLKRGRHSIAVDLKKPGAIEMCLTLIEKTDILLEGFRPGVMERLGLGPDACLERNPKLVYGRLTGWGQYGPLAQASGHDVNYISLSGSLHAIGPRDGKPVPPLSLVGDMGGGALYLAMGVLAAALEAKNSGKGQIVDAAMVDGAASLGAGQFAMVMAGLWDDKKRQANLLDGGAPHYDIYETKDGKYVSVASLEPKFYDLLRQKLNLQESSWDDQPNQNKWTARKRTLENIFLSKTRDEWCSMMEGTDVCFAPVLTYSEAPDHPHNAARQVFTKVDGILQPNVAPRFSRTPSQVQGGAAEIGGHNIQVLTEAGLSIDHIEQLKKDAAI